MFIPWNLLDMEESQATCHTFVAHTATAGGKGG